MVVAWLGRPGGGGSPVVSSRGGRRAEGVRDLRIVSFGVVFFLEENGERKRKSRGSSGGNAAACGMRFFFFSFDDENHGAETKAVLLLSRAQTRVQLERNCLFELAVLKTKHRKNRDVRRRAKATTENVPLLAASLFFLRSIASRRQDHLARSLAPTACARLPHSPLCTSHKQERHPELTWALLLRPGAPPRGAPPRAPPPLPPLPLAALRPRPPRGLRRFLSPPLEAADGPSTIDANATAVLGKEVVLLREKKGTDGKERRGEASNAFIKFVNSCFSLVLSQNSFLLFSSLFFSPTPFNLYDQPAEAPRRGSETGAQRSGHLEETGPVRARSGGLEEEARVRKRRRSVGSLED